MAVPIPSVSITVQDGQLSTADLTKRPIAVVGCSSAGTVDTPTLCANTTQLADFGEGPAISLASKILKDGKCRVLFVRTTAGQAKSIGSASHTGTGTSVLTVTGTPKAKYSLKVTATSSVTVGSGTFTITYSLDGGTTTSDAVTMPNASPSTYDIPGTGLNLSFGAGTIVSTDTFTSTISNGAALSSVTLTGTGDAMTVSGTPNDAYDVQVLVTRSGTPGTAPYPGIQVSLDGGVNFNGEVRLTATTYLVPSTGITLTFGGDVVEGDTYDFASTGPAWANANVSTALTALQNTTKDFQLIALAGQLNTTLFSTISTALETFADAGKYVRILTESPDQGAFPTESMWMDVLDAGWGALSGKRIVVCAGDEQISSPSSNADLSGFAETRSCLWSAAAQAAFVSIATDLAWVGLGPLPGVLEIDHDERQNEGLNADRFLTTTTLPTLGDQVYICNPITFAPNGSDFDLLQNGRVMDEACRVTRQFFTSRLSSSVRLDPQTGYIREADAQTLELKCNAALSASLITTRQASGSSVTVSRTDAIASTRTLTVVVKVVPLGYIKTVEETIGFSTTL